MGDDRRRGSAGRTALGIVVALLLLATACGSSSNSGGTSNDTTAENANAIQSEGTPVEGGKVIFAVTAETNGWNPALAQWADAGNFVGSTFLEPLFVYGEDANIYPWLAQSAEPNADFTSWKITVRKGIQFQDGTELTAQAMVDSILLAVRDGLSKYALADKFAEVVANDTYTFTVKLTIPWATFLGVLAGPVGYAMAPSMLAQDDKGQTNPVGTGPFKFESWKPDSYVKVRRFDGYWGGPCALPDPGPDVTAMCEGAGVPLGQKNGPFLDAIEFRPIPDALQRSNALESGDVNMILTTRANDVATLRGDYQVITDFNSEKTFTMLNVSKPPFDNIHARKALAYATDRNAVLQQINAGEPVASDTSPFSETSKWGGVPPDQTGYPQFDQELAKQEVAAYKADTGQDLSFVFSGLPPVEDQTIMQSLQEQWAQVGITAQVETTEQTAYILKLTQGDFEAAYFRNYGYPDPDNQYVFWSKSTAQPPIIINFSQFYNDTTENALSLGRTSTDFDTRRNAYQALSRERNDQAIDIWLFNTPYALIADNDIHGLNWFRVIPFGNFQPKPWMGGIWRG